MKRAERIARVAAALNAAGFPEGSVRTLETRAGTAAEAAEALHCEIGQIVKSLLFVRQAGTPVLTLVSGANRVDLDLLGNVLNEPAVKAEAKFVKSHTGFEIGGVPPLGHLERLETLMDDGLFKFDTVWSAAGSTHSVFPAKPEELAKITGAQRARIAS